MTASRSPSASISAKAARLRSPEETPAKGSAAPVSAVKAGVSGALSRAPAASSTSRFSVRVPVGVSLALA
jgi:hypothetical protein